MAHQLSTELTNQQPGAPSAHKRASIFRNDLVKTDLWADVEKEPVWAEVGARFGNAAANRDDIDIYQMCAFLYLNEDSKRKRYFYYLKAFICALIQTVGITIYFVSIVQDTLFDENDKLEICDSDVLANFDLRFLSFLLAGYISCKIGGLLRSISDKSLYHMNFWTFETCPPFVAPHWILFGGWVNVYALSISVLSSYCVIFASETMLDVFLNSVALFFVIEVDDFMLDSGDFDNIIMFFNGNEAGREEIGDRKTKYCDKRYIEWSHPEPGLMKKHIVGAVTAFIIGLIFFTCGVGVIAPFWILMCQPDVSA